MSSEIKVDTISENTSANGVAIDSLGIKDGKITNLMNATLSAADLGVGVHIKSADSSASASVHADELVIENSANAGLSILSGTSNSGSIFFGDSGDNDIGYIQYEHSTTNSLYFGTNAGTRMIIDSTGAVTKPNQPAFLVTPSTDQNNMANGVTIVFGAEAFDQNADFSGNVFTAPVTGKYLISGQCRVDAGSSPLSRFANAVMTINTSNRNYKFGYNNMYTNEDDQMMVWGTALCDMDANDACYLQWYCSRFGASGATTTVGDSSNLTTSLSGFLVA